MHQHSYTKQLSPMAVAHLKGTDDEELVGTTTHSSYMSLLGGVAWMALTRVDLQVFSQALQRRAHAPRVCDCKRLNICLRYIKNNKVGLGVQTIPRA